MIRTCWLWLVLVFPLFGGEAPPAPVRYGVDRDGFRLVVDLSLPKLPAEQLKLLERVVIQEIPEDHPAKSLTSLDEWVTSQHAATVATLAELKAKLGNGASLEGWFEETTITTTWSGGGVISMRFEQHAYTGGAHSMIRLYALAYDATTLQPFTLNDLIPPEKQAAFAEAVTTTYCSDQRIAPGTNLHQIGLHVDQLPAVLPLVEAAGLTVVYEADEVGPWSHGVVTVHLTRDQARPFLRRDPWEK